MSTVQHALPMRLAVLSAFVAAMAVAALPAAADITITTRETSEGLGGFANSTGTSTRIVAGDRGLTQTESKSTGKFSKFMGGGDKKTTQIVRLDRGLVWSVNDADKQYSEMTFEQMRENMRRGMEEMKKNAAQMEQAQAKSKKQAADANVKMEFETDVKRTGARQSFAGNSCEQVVITAISKVKDAKSDQEAGQMKFTIDGWYSKRSPGGSEILAFEKSFMEKLGMAEMARGLPPMASAMYGDALKEMGKKVGGLGYPLKSTFTVENVMSESTKREMANAREEQKKASSDAKASAAGADKAQAASDAANLGSSAARGDSKGISGALGGMLGRKMAKAAAKKAEQQAESAAQAGGGAGDGVLMRTTTEVLSISSGAVSGSRFEVPAGYKLVAPRLPGKDKND